MDELYQTHIAQSSIFLDCIDNLALQREASRNNITNDVLYEGYFLKRGHVMPSMKKRYGILTKGANNVLKIYHDVSDSKRLAKRKAPMHELKIISVFFFIW